MKSVVYVAFAGLASTAAAQSASLDIIATPEFVDGFITSFTLSVYGEADFGTHIAGGEFAVSYSGDSASSLTSMDASAADWGLFGENDRGYAGAGNHNGLVFGQLIAPPFFPPSEESRFTAGNPALLGTIVVSIDSNFGGFSRFDLVMGQGDFVLEIFDEADGSLTQLSSEVSFGSAVVSIPSPASTALLGLGGLVAGRRRR